MNLASKLRNESAELEKQKKCVADEIVDYFKDIFESGKFEKTLEKNILPNELNKRQKTLQVEFWEYSPGCSETYFRAGLHVWKNPEGKYDDSCNYKGVRLKDIQQKVGPRLLELTVHYLQEMGFIVTVRDAECWLKYYHKKIIISW